MLERRDRERLKGNDPLSSTCSVVSQEWCSHLLGQQKSSSLKSVTVFLPGLSFPHCLISEISRAGCWWGVHSLPRLLQSICLNPTSLNFRVCIKMKHLFLTQQPALAVQWLAHISSAETFPWSSSECLPAGCVPCPRAWPGAWQAHGRALSQRGLVIPTGCQGAPGVWVQPWCDSKALLSKSFWKGVHGKALENLCLQHKLLLQPPTLPLNSHPHSLKMMCNLCGKCRFNYQSKDSFMSTRAWFILLNVCSHVGSVQLCKFGAGSFCLFPSREWNSVVLFFISFFFPPPISMVVVELKYKYLSFLV